MPTGYTHEVQSGKITEFSDFAMTCARAFGALITMRDDPHGTPIPDEFVPDTYHQDALRDAKAHLASLEAMTVDQIETAARLAHEEEHASWASRKAERAEQRKRYEAMIAKTEAWTPPTRDHVELKAFMLQQLRDSLNFDCEYSSPEPVKVKRSEWYNNAVAAAKRDIDRHEDEHRKEVERCRGRTQWVKDLRASLSQPK